jgi:SAM-dependent methyltransferase
MNEYNLSPQCNYSIEEKNVKLVYEVIANHFSQTRFSVWSNVKEFIDLFKKNELIADIGCGNGKNMFRDDLNYIGIDFCKSFINICNNNINNTNKQFILGNILNIPIRNNSCDGVISVAVIHHLSTFNLRKKAVEELIRITKPAGKILIEVWAFENSKYKTQDTMINWTHRQKNIKPKKYERYYHLFIKDELLDLIPNNLVEITKQYNIYNNWVIELKKISK